MKIQDLKEVLADNNKVSIFEGSVKENSISSLYIGFLSLAPEKILDREITQICALPNAFKEFNFRDSIIDITVKE